MNWKQITQTKRNTVIDFYHAKCMGTHFMVAHSRHRTKSELYIGTNTVPIGKFNTVEAAIRSAENMAHRMMTA